MVAVFFFTEPDTVLEPVDVFEFVFVAVGVALTDSVLDSFGVQLWLIEASGVREGAAIDAVLFDEEDGVLLLAILFVLVTETVDVLDVVVLPVVVFDTPIVRDFVAETDGDFVEVIVRVSLEDPVPVFDAVVVAVVVAVPFTESVRGGEREFVALPVELRVSRVESVCVPLADSVLLLAILLVGLGELLDVFD